VSPQTVGGNGIMVQRRWEAEQFSTKIHFDVRNRTFNLHHLFLIEWSIIILIILMVNIIYIYI